MRFDETFYRTLDSLVLLARRLQGGRFAGERTSPRPGSSLDFRGFRAYTPGDDLRSVDWNVFARHGRLHVKEFAAERDLEALIAVDVSASMGFYGKREAALSVAAVLGTVALSRGDTLSWCAFAESRVAGGAGLRGKGRRAELLRGLEGAGEGRGTRLEAAAPASGENPGLVVVISDFCGPAADRALRTLRPRAGDLVALHVVAPGEIRPPAGGRLVLEDAESGERLEIDVDAAAVERYRAALDARWEGIRSRCLAQGIPYLRILAGTPLSDVVAALLRPGGALARR